MSKELVGQTLLNQYRVDAFIGSGGMAEVYRVWDLNRNVPLAMKVLRANLAEDPSIMKRFQREAHALQKLGHPNIVPFYGLYQTLDFTFLLMHFVDGPSLDDVLKERKTLKISEAFVYLKTLCNALGYAHSKGVVHCDVKPGNVLIDRGGNIFLTDFGIARHAESTTTTIASAGTPAYMPPEQIMGQVVAPSTDVYSLGAVLFKMLTGKTPFHGIGAGTEQSGSTAKERIRYGHMHLPPPDPREINPAVSVGIAGVVQKALSKTPADRYPTTSEFFEALCKAAGIPSTDIAIRVDASSLPGRSLSIAGEKLIADKTDNFLKQHISLFTDGSLVLLMLIALTVILLLKPVPAGNNVSVALKKQNVPSTEFVSPPIKSVIASAAALVPTPWGPPPLNEANYQQFVPIYKWEVGSDINNVTGIAISPIAKRIALLTRSYPESYKVDVRDLQGNKVWQASLNSKAAYPAIAISPDGKLVATGTDNGDIQLWSMADGNLLQTLRGHIFAVRVLEFSPDGKMLASGSSDQKALVWMIPSGMERQTYASATDVRDVAFSPDSHYVAVSSNVVFIWDAVATDLEGGKLWDNSGQTQNLSELAFSPDDQTVAAYGEWYNTANQHWRPRIFLWNYHIDNSNPTKIPVDDAIEDLAFSSDGKLLMGVYADRGIMTLIDISTREQIATINIGPKLLLSYSPDISMFAILSSKTMISIWGVEPAP